MKGPLAVQAAGGADTMRLRPNLCTETSQTARLARPGDPDTTFGASPSAIEHLATPPSGIKHLRGSLKVTVSAWKPRRWSERRLGARRDSTYVGRPPTDP